MNRQNMGPDKSKDQNQNKSRYIESAACRTVLASLSEYVDGMLPGRRVWEVEKHLSSCFGCAAAVDQMRVTVQLLHSTSRSDMRSDFMARLHTRLDAIEPAATRTPTVPVRLRDWTAGLQERLRMSSAPAFGMGVAVAGIGLLLVLPRLPGNVVASDQIASATRTPLTPPAQQAIDRHLAEVASDPFGDVAAEKLAMNMPSIDDNSRSESE